MAVNGHPLDRDLPCGADAGGLVEQVADGLEGNPVHQRACEHCQALLGELQELWSLTAVLAAEQVDVPERLDGRVLRQIRRQIFLGEVAKLFGGLGPRLGRALLVYAGLIQSRRET